MSFDHLAPHYRWMEHILAGDVLQKARLAHLAALDEAKHILLVGEGPGRFLGALRRRRPDVPVTVVDSSKAMLREAKKRHGNGPTTWKHADLRTWQPPAGKWDALVSHCVLDCFEPDTLKSMIPRLARGLMPTATWLVTDFAVPAAGWQKSRARLVHTLMYGTFRPATDIEARQVTDPSPFLEQSGFQLWARESFNHGLIQADHWRRP